MIAIRIEDFIDLEVYQQEIESLIEWVKSSPTLPDVEDIFVPGEYEIRTRKERLKTGIPIEEKTWNRLVETATSFGVPTPQL